MFAGQRPQPLSLKRANTTKELWSEPSSPATTFSWAAEKSAVELAGLLKNAHASLREKEKDLTLAAELGHYLLENNAALKAQYESLLRQQQDDDLCSQTTDDDPSDRQLVLLSQQQAHQRALGDLQDKNMELQRLLEDAQQHSDKLQMVHDRKARELEYDITLLKDHLDLATQHIEDMEQQRQQGHPTKQRRCQDDETVLVDLQNKIQQLEYDNSQLVHTRQSVQERLDRALNDVNALQHQFNLGQWTREGYAQLNEAYQRQFSHIAQLNVSLEEHRHTLTHLVEHGLALSHSSSNSATSTLKSHIDDRPSFCHTTLMAELEKAWHRDHGATSQWRSDDGYSSLPDSFKQQHGSTFTDTSCFYMPSPSDSNQQDDLLFGPLDSSDIKTSYNLYPAVISKTYSTGLLVAGQSKAHPIGMVTKVTRWCRFALVLTVAVFINVFEGPDGMLEEKY